MYSRTFYYAALFSLFIITCQVSCFHEMSVSMTNIRISDEQVQNLKKRTLIIILPYSQYDMEDAYNNHVSSAWTLSPVKAIRYSDFPKYNDPEKYSYLEIYGSQTTTNDNLVKPGSGPRVTNTHYYLGITLRYSTTDKKGKVNVRADKLSEVVLYPDFRTTSLDHRSKELDKSIYNTSLIRNYRLPYLLAYLRFFEKNVGKKLSPSRYIDYNDKQLKAKLAQDTLYIPDDLVHSFNMGKEKLKTEDVFTGYKGPYRLVSHQQLLDIINTRNNRPVFLFEYVLSSSDKYVSVWDVTSGSLAYRKYSSLTYNLKKSDMDIL